MVLRLSAADNIGADPVLSAYCSCSRYSLTLLDDTTAAPLKSSVRHSRRARVGNGVKARNRTIGRQEHGRVDMHQITDNFREAPFGEGISGYARRAMLHLGHRIEKMGEAGTSAMERLLHRPASRRLRRHGREDRWRLIRLTDSYLRVPSTCSART